MQEIELEERLRRAVRSGWLSPPNVVAQPKGFPFHIATCAVDLPAGCVPPPGNLGRRLGIGFAESAGRAARLALLEGVERFSLQFHGHMPELVAPCATIGGPAEPVQAELLALGAPGAALPVGSKGAAAGADLDSASRRAALELLEHHHAGDPPWPNGDFRRIDPTAVAALAALISWAEDRYRHLDLRFAPCDGYYVALASFSDLDGGRRTTGAAAGPALSDVVLHAAREAVLHWRNMVELDHAGTAASILGEEDRGELARYRGLPRPVPWPESPAHPIDPHEKFATASEDLLARLARQTGQRVRLFDMSRAEVGIPVVKVLLG